MRHQVSKLWASFLMILISAGFALTQNPTGSIHGTARDPHNAVVPNATITVTYKATNAVRKTDHQQRRGLHGGEPIAWRIRGQG
jgi:hypothetical protein